MKDTFTKVFSKAGNTGVSSSKDTTVESIDFLAAVIRLLLICFSKCLPAVSSRRIIAQQFFRELASTPFRVGYASIMGYYLLNCSDVLYVCLWFNLYYTLEKLIYQKRELSWQSFLFKQYLKTVKNGYFGRKMTLGKCRTDSLLVNVFI